MTIQRMHRKLQDTRGYFRNVDDLEVVGALNNLAGIVDDMLTYLEEQALLNEKHEQEYL